MAGNTQVKKGYSTYTNIPAQRDGYDVVETKTIERVPALTVGYTDFVGLPSKLEPLKEYGHTRTMSCGPKYAPTNHYDEYENLSLPVNPNKYTLGYFSGESNWDDSEPIYFSIGNIFNPNKSSQAVSPKTAPHLLTASTNNNNEALGTLEKYLYYSRGGGQEQGRFRDDSSNYAQPLEFGSGYECNAYAKPLEVGSVYEGNAYAQPHEFGSQNGFGAFVPKRKRRGGSTIWWF